MGYYSRLAGRIAINPPLTLEEIYATGFASDGDFLPDGKYKCVRIYVDGAGIIPDSDEERDLPYQIDQLQRLLANPVFADRQLTGYIVRIGEDNGDVERFDGRGLAEKARMFWPDGSEVRL